MIPAVNTALLHWRTKKTEINERWYIRVAENEKNAEVTPEEEISEETVNNEEASVEAAAEEEALSPEEKLTAEIEALKKELSEEKEKYLRLDAEYYNYRQRSAKEKADAYDSALINTVTEILTVVDNFERALAAQTEDENFKKGVDMIFRQYLAILDKLGVKEIEAEGKPFDPNFHNAVSQTEDESLGENTVAAVLQKGYVLGKKVIRHAMVTVANP